MARRFKLTPPKPAVMVENDVEKQCLDLLLYRGWYPIRLQVGRFKTVADKWLTIGKAGLPDYVVIHESHPGFFMETKRPKGDRSDVQIRVHWELTKAYRLAVVTIDGLDPLRAWLAAHEAKRKG
jgi:hypothetical protein